MIEEVDSIARYVVGKNGDIAFSDRSSDRR